MSAEAFARFREAVLASPSLQRQLLDVPARRHFEVLVVRLATEHGFDVTAADVELALAEATRTWRERWI